MYRVIWQYSAKALGDLEAATLPSVADLVHRDRSVFAEIPLLGAAEPVFRSPKPALRAQLLALPGALAEEPTLDLAGYHHAFVREHGQALLLAERLQNTAGVRYAEVQGRLRVAEWVEKNEIGQPAFAAPPPFVPATVPHVPTDPLEAGQRYLDPAPVGVDARHAWGRPGGRGEGVRVVDIEYGWNFSHEDLLLVHGGVVFGLASNSDHGTKVLGVFSGDQNSFGVTGIASEATAMAAAAEYDFASHKWNAAAAIEAAISRLGSGDVILLEMHGPGPNSAGHAEETQIGFVPVEFWQSEFAAIQTAVAAGIHVVEAAGNGGEDLDAAVYQGRFDRATCDSGAILVGGGSALGARPRARMSWSNFGSRLDVQGWGEAVVTTGGHERPDSYDLVFHQDPNRCYTRSFGGTSAASPIVAGAVAAVSGAHRARTGQVLSPAAMRELLAATGSPQPDGAAQPAAAERIGPLPDLQRAFEALGL